MTTKNEIVQWVYHNCNLSLGLGVALSLLYKVTQTTLEMYIFKKYLCVEGWVTNVWEVDGIPTIYYKSKSPLMVCLSVLDTKFLQVKELCLIFIRIYLSLV